MNEWILALSGAVWLGILTSISPCPLATNIAAISFVGRNVDRPFHVFLTGLLYTFGRSIVYIILGILIVNSLLSVPGLAHWLQKYMYRLLGPILIIVGMLLLNLLRFGSFGGSIGQWCQQRAEKFGLAGAFLLGLLFALSFCPVSAALFFGSLIPLSVKHSSGILLPLLYGVGTAIPVFGFGIVVAMGANSVAKVFAKVTQFEKWARTITGALFIGTGVLFTLLYTFGLKAMMEQAQ